VSKEELLTELCNIKETEDKPTMQEIEENCEYGVRAYRDRFGSVKKAVQRANKEPNRTEDGEEEPLSRADIDDVAGYVVNVHGIEKDVLQLKIGNPDISKEKIADELGKSTALVRIILEDYEELVKKCTKR
jgi:hypothetical protein